MVHDGGARQPGSTSRHKQTSVLAASVPRASWPSRPPFGLVPSWRGRPPQPLRHEKMAPRHTSRSAGPLQAPSQKRLQLASQRALSARCGSVSPVHVSSLPRSAEFLPRRESPFGPMRCPSAIGQRRAVQPRIGRADDAFRRRSILPGPVARSFQCRACEDTGRRALPTCPFPRLRYCQSRQ